MKVLPKARQNRSSGVDNLDFVVKLCLGERNKEF